MRGPIVVIGAALLLVVCAGCFAPSLHPLYTEKELVFEPGLIGAWREKPQEGTSSDGETWTFEKKEGEEKAYRLTILADDGPSPFYAHLVRLDGNLFLDLVPEEMDYGDGDGEGAPRLPLWTALHLMPIHTFWRVWLEKAGELRLGPLGTDWLRERMDDGSIQIKHEDSEDDGYLLTAAPADLQELMRKCVEHTEAFADVTTMVRVETTRRAPEEREGDSSSDES